MTYKPNTLNPFKWFLDALVQKRIATYQSDLLQKHFEEVETIYRQMRGWRHDYHNHMQVLKAYLEMSRYSEMQQHLEGLLQDFDAVDQVVKSGNLMFDAILNSKMALVRAAEIEINAKATVPANHGINDVDLCAIVGNLLDNALEGCRQVQNKEDRFIRVFIRPMKDQLYISVTNSALGRPTKSYFSTKKETGHGFGLRRIDSLVAKYGGYVNRQVEEGVFATEISIPFKLN